jgi:hypothetical protein
MAMSAEDWAAGREAARIVERRLVDLPQAVLDPSDPALIAFGGDATVLAQFCAFVDASPSELIDGIFDREAYAYVRRQEFSAKIVEFQSAGGGDWDAQKSRGDVVRTFFLANGHRIAPARTPWQRWAQMP